MPFREVSLFQPVRVEIFIKVSRFFSSSALNASGGTSLSPGDLPFDNFVTACFNYFQEMSVSISRMKCCWGSS